jgi:hypothetical protein
MFLNNNENGDVLCHKIPKTDVLQLHLLVSSDGGNLYSTGNVSFWPFHAIVLDLPLQIRCASENVMLMALWKGSKPKWKVFLKYYLHNFLRNAFHVQTRHGILTIRLKLSLAVLDLPALASIMEITQYNGKFGCPMCKHPGNVKPRGKGHTMTYPHDQEYDLKTTDFYVECVALAETSGVPVFGVRGKSVLYKYLSPPCDFVLDSMHLLFENCFRTLLKTFFDPDNRNHSFYLGRRSKLNCITKIISSIRMPHDMPKIPAINCLSIWKAHDFRNFLLLFSLPILGSSLPSSYMIHLAAFVFASRYCTAKCADHLRVILVNCLSILSITLILSLAYPLQ